jgi:hypothetical protein
MVAAFRLVCAVIKSIWILLASAIVDECLERIARVYRRFVQHEAHRRSLLYEELANEVARDLPTLGFLSDLIPSKRQPNLLFAAMRCVCGTANSWQEFRESLNTHRDQIRETMMKRRTQTNEPARCATLLPLLALLPQPLALLEIGASAGLCLLPDLYSYKYNDGTFIAPSSHVGVTPPVFLCTTNAKTPIPDCNVEVVWRAGLDLEPVDLHDQDGTTWLEALVWPGEHDRLRLLRQAIDVARNAPPQVIKGDLRVNLPELAAQAPSHATLVIFHSAVLVYIETAAERDALADVIAGLGAVWISNEISEVSPCENKPPNGFCPSGQFLLARDKMPIACLDPHGSFAAWF